MQKQIAIMALAAINRSVADVKVVTARQYLGDEYGASDLAVMVDNVIWVLYDSDDEWEVEVVCIDDLDVLSTRSFEEVDDAVKWVVGDIIVSNIQ